MFCSEFQDEFNFRPTDVTIPFASKRFPKSKLLCFVIYFFLRIIIIRKNRKNLRLRPFNLFDTFPYRQCHNLKIQHLRYIDCSAARFLHITVGAFLLYRTLALQNLKVISIRDPSAESKCFLQINKIQQKMAAKYLNRRQCITQPSI